jgi:hypothetical protein
MRGTDYVTRSSSTISVTGQTRTMSFIEAITDVAVGLVLAVLTQCAVLP